MESALALSDPDTVDDDETDLLLPPTANGLDVDPFVAAVVGGDGALGVAPVSLSEKERADIEQPGALSDAPSVSPIVKQLANRASELHRPLAYRLIHPRDELVGVLKWPSLG